MDSRFRGNDCGFCGNDWRLEWIPALRPAPRDQGKLFAGMTGGSGRIPIPNDSRRNAARPIKSRRVSEERDSALQQPAKSTVTELERSYKELTPQPGRAIHFPPYRAKAIVSRTGERWQCEMPRTSKTGPRYACFWIKMSKRI